MAEGGLVPFELTVQILINGLIANPSKNYLIDGFPRAVEQAIYFEQHVCECQQVLFYDVNEDTLMERCLARASQSVVQREDDNAETLRKRLKAFQDYSRPVVDLYKKFGKVRTIDASQSIAKVYEETRQAVLPQVHFILGPPRSGKKTLGAQLAERTNMTDLYFEKYLSQKNLNGKDDETIVNSLIHHLVNQASPRVLIYDFPQNEAQAKYFAKNCVSPQNVFYVKCSKDDCQERMLELPKDSTEYLPSAILSKKIRNFNEQGAKLLPLLKSTTNFLELDTSSQTFAKSFKDICTAVEPTVINVISHGEGEDETFARMMETLTQEGYVRVPVNELISLENERKTDFGRIFMQNIATGKVIPSDQIVHFLRKVLYSGDGHKKYILTGDFPTSTEQVREFEKSCASISSVIYSGSKREDMISYNIPNNMLRVFETKSLFLKENRLQVVAEWDAQNWQEIFDSVKVDWCLVTGSPLSGKTTVTKYLQKHIGSQRAITVIDHKEHESAIRASMGTADGPYEGEVPLAKVEDSIVATIQRDKKAGKRAMYVFDSFPGHKSAADFARFVREKLRCPADFIVSCQINQDGAGTLAQRFKKKLEVEADLSEEQQDQYRNMMNEYQANIEPYISQFSESTIETGRTRLVLLDTTASSEEYVANTLKDFLAPKVILLNHEKTVPVDVVAANISIKFNFMYISVYQLIKQHVEANTQWGKRLLLTKK